ncbi:hypothetical protein BH23GEM3_BH23GEM3_24230 [soil metagenome]
MNLFFPFGWVTGAAAERVERRIAELHQRAAAAAPGRRAIQWAGTARFCLQHGETGRALSYYGRGIDDHLFAEQYGEAAELCREVIRVSPGVVRARCTLAFLSLRGGYSATFMRDITDYTRAARHAGQEEMALTRLRMMAGVTSDGAARRFLDRQIDGLSESRGGDKLIATTYSREGRPLLPIPGNQEDRWAFVLRLSIAGPCRAEPEPEPSAA